MCLVSDRLAHSLLNVFITCRIRIRRSQAKCVVAMAVCVCVCLSNPDIILGSGMWCPLAVHYLADLQLVHGFRCCGNTRLMRNVSENASTRCVAGLLLCFDIAGWLGKK